LQDVCHLRSDRDNWSSFPLFKFGAVNPPAFHIRNLRLDRDAYAAIDTVRADQTIAKFAMSANISRIAERLETDNKLTVRTSKCVSAKRSILAEAFEKSG